MDLWVLDFQEMREEMLDLLRIVDDGAAGRRGGHLRFTKGLNRAERGGIRDVCNSLKHKCLGYVHVSLVPK